MSSRFTQASEVGFLDNAMYENPTELMAMALKNKDNQVNDFMQNLSLFDEIDILRNKADDPYAQQIRSDIDSKVDALSREGMSDKLNISKYTNKVRDLQREVNRSVKEGDIHHLRKNYEAIEKMVKSQEELYKTDPSKFVGVDDVSEIRGYVQSKYQGFKDEEGGYVNPQEIALVGREETSKLLEEAIKGHTAFDHTFIRGNSLGGRTRKDTKGLTEAELMGSIKTFIDADQSIQKTIEQELEFEKYRGNKNITYEDVRNRLEQDMFNIGQEKYFKRVTHDEKHTYIPTPESSPGTKSTGPNLVSYENALVTNGANEILELAERDPENLDKAIKEYSKARKEHYSKSLMTSFDPHIQKLAQDSGIEVIGMTDSTPFLHYIDEQGNVVDAKTKLLAVVSQGERQSRASEYDIATTMYISNNILEESLSELVSTQEGKDQFMTTMANEKYNNIVNKFSTNNIDRATLTGLQNAFKAEWSNLPIDVKDFESRPVATNTYMSVQRKGETREQAKQRLIQELGTAYKPDETEVYVVSGIQEEVSSSGTISLNNVKNQIPFIQSLKGKMPKTPKKGSILDRVLESYFENNTTEGINIGSVAAADQAEFKNALDIIEKAEQDAQLILKDTAVKSETPVSLPESYTPGRPVVMRGAVTYGDFTLTYPFNVENGYFPEEVVNNLNNMKSLYAPAENIRQSLGGKLLHNNVFVPNITSFNHQGTTYKKDDNGRLLENDKIVSDESTALQVLALYIHSKAAN